MRILVHLLILLGLAILVLLLPATAKPVRDSLPTPTPVFQREA